MSWQILLVLSASGCNCECSTPNGMGAHLMLFIFNLPLSIIMYYNNEMFKEDD